MLTFTAVMIMPPPMNNDNHATDDTLHVAYKAAADKCMKNITLEVGKIVGNDCNKDVVYYFNWWILAT